MGNKTVYQETGVRRIDMGEFIDGKKYVSGIAAITGGTMTEITKTSWAAATELTLATDIITVTQSLHLVDTQADAASDDLVTINGGADGQLLAIRAAHTDRTVVVKSTGNINNGGSDISLTDTSKYLLFVYDGALSKWVVVGGSAAAVDLASPGPIGGTTPAAGTFTDLLGNGVYVAVSTDLAVTAAQMKGQTFVCASTNTPVLPAAAVGLKGSFIAATADVFSVDINATPGTDIFVLAGTAQAAGAKITSDGTIYAEVYIECKIAGKWIATPVQGLFVNGG